MIGRVENDDPMPMVTSRPTRSIAKAAIALLLPNSPAVAWTRGSTCPEAFITEAKPCAVIMMKPINAIMRIPEVNTSSASRRRTTPVAMKTHSPTRATTTFGLLTFAGAATSTFASGS